MAHGQQTCQQSPGKRIIIEHMDRYSAWTPRTASIHVLGASSVILFSMHFASIAHFFRRRPDIHVRLWEGDADGSADAPRAQHTVSKVRAYAKACSAVDRAWHVRICRLALLADAGLQDVDLLISVAVFSRNGLASNCPQSLLPPQFRAACSGRKRKGVRRVGGVTDS